MTRAHTNVRVRTMHTLKCLVASKTLHGLEALDELLQPRERVATAAALRVLVLGEEQVVEIVAARPAGAAVGEDVAALRPGLLAPHRVRLGVDAVERTLGGKYVGT